MERASDDGGQRAVCSHAGEPDEKCLPAAIPPPSGSHTFAFFFLHPSMVRQTVHLHLCVVGPLSRANDMARFVNCGGVVVGRFYVHYPTVPYPTIYVAVVTPNRRLPDGLSGLVTLDPSKMPVSSWLSPRCAHVRQAARSLTPLQHHHPGGCHDSVKLRLGDGNRPRQQQIRQKLTCRPKKTIQQAALGHTHTHTRTCRAWPDPGWLACR